MRGSSVIMTCAALGLLLRVSYELDRAQRQVARVRNETALADVVTPSANAPAPRTPAAPPRPAAARGTARLQQRIEPSFGRGA